MEAKKQKTGQASTQYISPISIDLGAKNTGVYFNHYKAYTPLDQIKKNAKGKVYQLDNNSYTLLMAKRTAKRHQKRGHDRRQMVKRLFKLIWTKHFKLDWDDEVQQATSFLFNRRGFSFLTGQYDEEILKEFPESIFNDFPQKLKDELKPIVQKTGGHYDFTTAIDELSNEKEKLKSIIKQAENKKITKEPIWRFNIKKFDLETANFEKEKTHLHHLFFTFYQIKQELDSGARHRNKYFEEIKDVLTNKNHKHKYLQNFCHKLQTKQYKYLDENKLLNLIGNLSNFELKILRSYFNDKKHKREDDWNKNRLEKVFKHWILNIWRVNPKKDKNKAEGKDYNYKKLREDVKKIDNIIDFLLNTDPNWTTPPYQNNNNRRPPKCQSLIFNIKYLDKNYKDWKIWLEQLKENSKDYLKDYNSQLEDLKSGKNKGYFSYKMKGELKKDSEKRGEQHLQARLLQFLFDRSKKIDDLKLNEIFSITKKIKQNKRDQKTIEEEKNKLEELINKLPENLKTTPNFKSDDIFPSGSFLHLICKYYKLRQRARAGRLFIHPKYSYVKNRGYENTGRFDETNNLLTYCNHKPRQKKYQLFNDVSALLQILPKDLKEIISSNKDEDLCSWLEEKSKGLKNNCQKASAELKNRRGNLKPDIKEAYRQERKQQNTKSSKLKTSQSKDQKNEISEYEKLVKLSDEAKYLYLEIAKIIDKSKINELTASLEQNPAKAVYFLAQINNLVFKDRSGNSKTCAVCSMDNAQRMETIKTKNNYIAKASRLPAIETRVIDGAVMKIAKILGKAIAKEKWLDIEEALKNNEKVCIPIVTESNQFEFEPSKEELVKRQRVKGRKGKVLDRNEALSFFNKKEERIKSSNSKNICPYYGTKILAGEVDHIIPRRSQWGTLNDEANLIWASREGNQHKTNQPLPLSCLKRNYKKSIFENKTDEEIKNWIKETIWDKEKEDFKFGKYTNFINLSEDEQKAFRHALFLLEDPIRQKVIEAINNRNRAFVNGTQRYFAEVLANEIYKKAKREKMENLLNFDYFSVPAQEIHGDRKRLEKNKDKHPELKNHKKYNGNKPEVQTSYSHLIDAQIAFLKALSSHYSEGSFKVEADNINPIDDYGKIKVSDNDVKPSILKRKKIDSKKGNASHRTFFDVNPGAWHFLKLIEIKINSSSYYLKGFLNLKKLAECLDDNWLSIKKKVEEKYGEKDEQNKKHSYAAILDESEGAKLAKLYCIGKHQHEFGYKKDGRYYPKLVLEKKIKNKNIQIFLHQIDKSRVARFLLEKFNTKTAPKDWEEEDCKVFEQLEDLWYFTKRINLKDTVNLKDYKLENFKMKELLDCSLKKAWEEVHKKWKGYINIEENSNIQNFLKNHFTKESQNIFSHLKSRKVFSLPIKSQGQGFILIRRKSWNDGYIYQLQSEKSDSGPGRYKTYINQDNEVFNLLANHYRSKNLVVMKKMKGLEKELQPVDSKKLKPIDEHRWYPLDVPENLTKIINSIENMYQSKPDSQCKVSFKNEPSIDDIINLMDSEFKFHEFKWIKSKSQTKEFFRDCGSIDKGIEKLKNKIEELKKEIKDSKKIENDEIEKEKKILKNKEKKILENWKKFFEKVECGDKHLTYKIRRPLKIANG